MMSSPVANAVLMPPFSVSSLADDNYYDGVAREDESSYHDALRFLLVPAVAEEYPLLRSVNLLVSALSMASCQVVIGGYLLLPHLRKFFTRLILYLSIADMWLACASVIGHFPNPSSTGCLVQSTFFVFFSLASFLWSSAISHSLRLLLFRGKQTPSFKEMEVETKMHKVCWGVPFGVTLCVVLTHGYGPAGFWCWIQGRNSYGSALRFLLFYVPLWATSLYNVYVYLALTKRLRLLMSEDAEEFNASMDGSSHVTQIAVQTTELVDQNLSMDGRTQKLVLDGDTVLATSQGTAEGDSASSASSATEGVGRDESGGRSGSNGTAAGGATSNSRPQAPKVASTADRRTEDIVTGQVAAASSSIRAEVSSSSSSRLQMIKTSAGREEFFSKSSGPLDAGAVESAVVVGRPLNDRGPTSGNLVRENVTVNFSPSLSPSSSPTSPRIAGTKHQPDSKGRVVRSLEEDEVAQLRQAQLRNLRRLFYFPLLLVFCWSFGSLNRLLNWFGVRLYVLDFLTVTFGGLQGFLNACCYFFTNPGVREQFAQTLLAQRSSKRSRGRIAGGRAAAH
ncbi:unnamed protein product [Amoebophrya sp. A120]|nr:unnamed protein product [Amoebophrya sp. A120]|eukprot:GSA120T00002897001.1